MSEKSYIKPPIGIIPKSIWERQRINALWDAILRYREAKIVIPIIWIEEYNELIERNGSDER